MQSLTSSSSFFFFPLSFILLLFCRVLTYLSQNEWKELSAFPVLSRQRVCLTRESMSLVALSFTCTAVIIIIYQQHHLIYYFTILYGILVFSPYMMKTSPFIACCAGQRRSCGDKLMVSSMVYAVASFLSWFWYQDFEYGFLCLVTTSGSLVYHYFRESRFFNFDNIFATVHFFVYSFTLIESYDRCNEYFLFGLVSFPIAAFALVHCGLPAEISSEISSPSSRKSRVIYDNWHTVWHLSSGVGPILSLYFLHNYFSNESVSGILSPRANIYATAVAASVLINIGANILGIIPLD